MLIRKMYQVLKGKKKLQATNCDLAQRCVDVYISATYIGTFGAFCSHTLLVKLLDIYTMIKLSKIFVKKELTSLSMEYPSLVMYSHEIFSITPYKTNFGSHTSTKCTLLDCSTCMTQHSNIQRQCYHFWYNKLKSISLLMEGCVEIRLLLTLFAGILSQIQFFPDFIHY